jgi:hypothetical protein
MVVRLFCDGRKDIFPKISCLNNIIAYGDLFDTVVNILSTPSIPVLRAHFANLLAQGYFSLALILLSNFSFIRALN